MLVRCHRIYGGTTLLSSTPRHDVYEDVVYVPMGAAGSRPGIYDRGRKLVTSSAFFRGVPSVHPVMEGYTTDLKPDDLPLHECEADYVYVGHVPQHYGHFLVSCLSRFWHHPLRPDRKTKFLYLDGRSSDEVFATAFIGDILGALGLASEDFIHFDRPLRLSRLIIPAPSFEENNYVHQAYADLCHRVGDALTADLDLQSNHTPIFLSKAKLASGVSCIENEQEFCDFLERRGVDVVYPETLDFRRQVALFRERSLVTGGIGSALHTGVFSPDNKLVVLNHGEEVWSNQILIDRVNGNDSLYLHPRGELHHRGSTKAFGNNFVLADPARTASEFLRAIDAFMDAKHLRLRRWDDPDETCDMPKLLRPEGMNLARAKPAQQSSRSTLSRGSTPEEDAEGAVSGLLTGYYQFHTDTEVQPWWQVDLLDVSLITEVRIYNRLDVAGHRAARFVLLGGLTVEGLSELTRREEQKPFGGLDGLPFIWRPPEPVTARFVRVRSLITDCFHFDQIEIFGSPLH